MMLAEIYRKIISKEPYKDMGVFFESYESFEEIPLVSRYKRLDFLKKEMSNDKVSEVLAGGRYLFDESDKDNARNGQV